MSEESYFNGYSGKFYVVNIPFIFKSIWMVVYAFLPAAVKNKIVFINDMKELLYHFDASVLPVEYGGTCKCEGGCIPVYKCKK